jgi:hypothetical protein
LAAEVHITRLIFRGYRIYEKSGRIDLPCDMYE